MSARAAVVATRLARRAITKRMALLLFRRLPQPEGQAADAGQRCYHHIASQRQMAERAHERVAQAPERAVVRLKERRQPTRGELVVTDMAAAHAFVAGERLVDVRVLGERPSERPGVDQRQVRALAELRTGAVRRVADEE